MFHPQVCFRRSKTTLKLTEKIRFVIRGIRCIKDDNLIPLYCELLLTYLYPVPTFDLVFSVEVDYENRNTHVSLRRTIMNDVD